MSTIDTDKLSREKWDAERKFREKEISLQERKLAVEEENAHRSQWRSPLVLAVLGAAVAALGNAVVAYMNGNSLHGVERFKAGQQFILETEKAEAARILEVIKADPDTAATNLEFLLEAGLINNETRRIDLLNYLRGRKPGEGPSIPQGDPSGNIAGRADVLDGDTISYTVRLIGIDTPELRQMCKTEDGVCYNCGQAASEHLASLMGGDTSGSRKTVSCEFTGQLTFGRPVATCSIDGTDIGETMIRDGWAYAHRRYIEGEMLERYVSAEDEARLRKVGVWQGEHISPGDWRRNPDQRTSCE